MGEFQESGQQFWRILGEHAGLLTPAPDSGRSEPPKSFFHQQLEMEARVGIGQRLHLSKTSPKPFGSGDFSNCCTGK